MLNSLPPLKKEKKKVEFCRVKVKEESLRASPSHVPNIVLIDEKIVYHFKCSKKKP